MADKSPIALDREEYVALLMQRAWWDILYRDLSDYFQFARARFLSSDANRPKRNTKNARNRALLSVRVARAGLMGGLTPQARPWFALTTPDPAMAEFGPVKEWLYDVQLRMFGIFARTNVYDSLHESYGDDVTFGISSLNIEDDDADLIRGYVAPVGSFVVANSARLEVDTWYQRTTMTVKNLVQRFGLDACSITVRNLYNTNALHSPIEVIHAIKPRTAREYGAADSKNMPWQSCWFEAGANPEDKYLKESGYREFPIMCSRWEKTGEDAYGKPPAADCLGVAMGLQKFESRRLQALDMLIRPPMNAPTSLRADGGGTTQPGDFNYYDPSGPHARIEPAVVVDPRMFIEAREELRDLESQIDAAMFVDLFLLIANDTRSGITAEEIRAKKEERLLQVGPTIQRIQREKLKPLIDRSFAILLRRGELPPPPKELSGVNLGVEFLAPLAAAQRAVETESLERTTAFAINGAKVFPAMLDLFDEDEAFKAYARAVGTPPKIVRDDEKVQQIRADRQKQDEAKQAAEMAKPAKDAAIAAQIGATTVPEPGNLIEKAAQATGPAVGPLPPNLSAFPGRAA